MGAPGIEVRPLRTIAGSSEFSEVFFTDVRIPVENRVGKENDGWRVAMVTFSFERGTAFVGELVRSMKLVEELAELARKLPRGSGSAWDDGGVRRELGLIAAQLDGLWHLTNRTITEAERTGVPGIGGSLFQLHYSEGRPPPRDPAVDVFGAGALATEDEAGA